MGRSDEPIIPFIDNCIKRAFQGREAYKGFKVQTLVLSAEIKILILAILFPRKKRKFDDAFEDLFKGYERSRKRPYKGYAKKDNIRATIKKNKRRFQVIFNNHGIFIFRKRLNCNFEQLMTDAEFFNIKSPYSETTPDTDRIEDFYEKVMREVILPKFLFKFSGAYIERIQQRIDLNSSSSGYESTISSPFSLSSNSPDLSELQANSLSVRETNEGNSSLLASCSSGSHVTILENKINLPVLQNQPSTSSGGTVTQNFGEPIPFDNLESMDFEESQSLEEFQRNVNNLISETLKDYPSFMEVNSNPENNVLAPLSEIQSDVPDHNYSALNLNSTIEENTIGNNKEMPFVENPEYDKVNNIESVQAASDNIHQIPDQNIIWYQVLIPVVLSTTNNSDGYSDSQYTDSCSGVLEENCTMTPTENFGTKMNYGLESSKFLENKGNPQYTESRDGVVEDNSSTTPTENLGTSMNSSSSVPYTERKEDKLVFGPQYIESCNGVLENNPIMNPTENHDANMNNDLVAANFSENNSSVPYTEGKEKKLILGPQYIESCNGVLENNPIMNPTENHDANMNNDLVAANFSENNSSVPYTEGKEKKLILGVPNETELFLKHSSMTKNAAQVTDENYPSITEFCQVGFEILEEMESDPGLSFSETTCMSADNRVENLHDPSKDEHGSTFFSDVWCPKH